MTVLERLENIKKILFADATPPPATPPPAQPSEPLILKCKDGTEIGVTLSDPATSMAPNAGDAVTVAGSPAPAGDYELEDGTVLKVDGSGMLCEVVVAAPAQEPPAQMDHNYEEQFTAINEKFSQYEQKFSNYESRFALAEQTITRQENALKQMFEIVEKLAAIPTADPVQKPAGTFASQKESREDRIKRLATAVTDFKEKNK